MSINIIKIKTKERSILIIEPLESELVAGKIINYILNNLSLINHSIEQKNIPSTRIDVLEIKEDMAFKNFLELLEQPGIKHDFHYFELNNK